MREGAVRRGNGLRVLAIVGDPGNGVAYARFVQPFSQLGRYGLDLAFPPPQLELVRGPGGWEPSPTILNGVSILMFPQMVLSPVLPDGSRLDAVGGLCREAQRRGIPVVWSLDDWLEGIEPGNPSYEVVSESARNVRALAEAADVFFVTTPVLADTLAPWRKPTWVLPNAIDPGIWRPRPRRSGELRVGWAGSSSHLEDLRVLAAAVPLVRRKVGFRLCLLGLVDRPLPAALAEARALLPGLVGSQRVRAELFCEIGAALLALDPLHRPFTTIDRYFSELPALDCDVAVCPLLDTPFNRHKSAIKFYEYAAAGSMTIASAVPPYRDEVSVTVENDPRAWADAIEAHLRDPARREAELAAQRAFVVGERSTGALRPRWAEALASVASRSPAARAGAVS
jgi:glycosyltransferase involved in cell wall biosynthesis